MTRPQPNLRRDLTNGPGHRRDNDPGQHRHSIAAGYYQHRTPFVLRLCPPDLALQRRNVHQGSSAIIRTEDSSALHELIDRSRKFILHPSHQLSHALSITTCNAVRNARPLALRRRDECRAPHQGLAFTGVGEPGRTRTNSVNSASDRTVVPNTSRRPRFVTPCIGARSSGFDCVPHGSVNVVEPEVIAEMVRDVRLPVCRGHG